MSSSIQDAKVAVLPQRTATPSEVRVCLPMVPDIGTVAGALFYRVAHAWDLRPQLGSVGAAVQAVVDESAGRTTGWSPLELSVEHDDHDVYVRLAMDVAVDAEPALSAGTDALVAGVTQSHHVVVDDGRLLVVLQASLG